MRTRSRRGRLAFEYEVYAFHDEGLMQAAQAEAEAAGEEPYMPAESAPLRGLDAARVALVRSIALSARRSW